MPQSSVGNRARAAVQRHSELREFGLGGASCNGYIGKGDPQVMEHWMVKFKETPAAPTMGMPEDIAQIVAFLCEVGSRWCIGSMFNANGGMVPV